ncbi:MAG: CBS domain-containing protein, partial [Candidatus Limnocylindrales bacterium]
TRPAASTQPESTVRDAVGQLLGRDFRALPVTDDGGRLVGILTGGDRVGRGGLEARLELLAVMPSDVRAAILARLDPRAAVGAIMTPEPVSVRETDTLATATHLMAEREIKRLPVIDAEGRLSGMLSRSDVLRAVSETFLHDVVDGEAHPGAHTVADLMRRDAPTVAIDANLATVLDAVVSTRLNRAVVVDRAGRVVGVITDSDLIGSVDLGGGVLNALMRSVGQRPGATVTAGELLARDLVTVGSATTIAAAARLMITNRRKILCVVDSSGMLLGIVDRADLLRAAGDALHELKGVARSDD